MVAVELAWKVATVLFSGPPVEHVVTLASSAVVLDHAEQVHPKAPVDDSPCRTPDAVGKKAASAVVVAMSELTLAAGVRIAAYSVTGHGWLPWRSGTTLC